MKTNSWILMTELRLPQQEWDKKGPIHCGEGILGLEDVV